MDNQTDKHLPYLMGSIQCRRCRAVDAVASISIEWEQLLIISSPLGTSETPVVGSRVVAHQRRDVGPHLRAAWRADVRADPRTGPRTDFRADLSLPLQPSTSVSTIANDKLSMQETGD